MKNKIIVDILYDKTSCIELNKTFLLGTKKMLEYHNFLYK